MAFWGYHLIIDASWCIKSQIRNKANIEAFARNLVKKIDMVPYGEPQVQHFGSGNKAGYTLVQLIETSNICAHFVEETNDVYLDVFSCKNFSTTDVEMVLRQHFSPQMVNKMFLTRQAPRHFVENGSNPNILQLK
jgi:S-adenosylmethionine/arginine decarboxylase-like enzyme